MQRQVFAIDVGRHVILTGGRPQFHHLLFQHDTIFRNRCLVGRAGPAFLEFVIRIGQADMVGICDRQINLIFCRAIWSVKLSFAMSRAL